MFLSSQGVKVLAFLAGPDQRAKQLEAGGTAATSCVGVQGRQNETTMNVQYSVVPRQNETTMTVEYSGIQQPKLKWDLKSLEVAKKNSRVPSHEDYRRLVLCPGGETEGRGSDVSMCTVHRFRPCKRKTICYQVSSCFGRWG